MTSGTAADSVKPPDSAEAAVPWYFPNSFDTDCIQSCTPAPIPSIKYPTVEPGRTCSISFSKHLPTLACGIQCQHATRLMFCTACLPGSAEIAQNVFQHICQPLFDESKIKMTPAWKYFTDCVAAPTPRRR